MKPLAMLTKVLTLLSLLFFFNLALNDRAAAQIPQLKSGAENAYTLPAGTVIRVRMDNGISSRSATVDDTFTTTVSVPVFVRSVEVIPKGTVIEGRVVKVGHAKRGGTDGFIAVTFETMRLPGGQLRKIAGELSGVDEENDPDGDDPLLNDNEDDSSMEKVAFIAGGAGAGALLGGAVKGGTGAVIGGAVGAGAGALASYFRRGDEASIKTNAEVGILLKQSVTLPAQDY